MESRRRGLHRALHDRLPVYVGKIRKRRLRSAGRRLRLRGGKRRGTVQVPQKRRNIFYPVNGKPPDDRRLRRVFIRNVQLPYAAFRRRNRHRKRALYKAKLAAQRNLADKGALRKVGADHARNAENRDKNRKIKGRARFPHIRGRQIHHKRRARKLDPAVLGGGSDPHFALLNRQIRKTDNIDPGQTLHRADLRRDGKSVQPEQPDAVYFCEHGGVSFPEAFCFRSR